MKIDSHQHFWHYHPSEYGWIGKGMEVLMRDFLPGDLWAELSGNDYSGSVVVQARQTLEETEWLLSLAETVHFIKGVVGWVDLCSEEAESQLNRYSRLKKLVGVRHVIHDEPDDDFMLRPEFMRGISLLGKYGLTYDLLLFPKHLPGAIKLVRQFPEQPFVLDHISKPLIAENKIQPWKNLIFELAQYPNVYCKLSGMVTEAGRNNLDKATFIPYLDVVFEAFGTDRLMIGSDWPVCLLGGSYFSMMNIVLSYITRFESGIRDNITGGNCIRFYNIPI